MGVGKSGNLITATDRTPEARRKLGSIGGKKSGIVRRKKRIVTEALRQALTDGKTKFKIRDPKTGEIREVVLTVELFNQGVLKRAVKGDVRAWEVVTNRLEGLPRQKLEHSGEGLQLVVGEKEKKAIDQIVENNKLEDDKKE